MTYYVDDEKIGQKSIQYRTQASESKEIDLLIHSLGIIIKVGRYFPIILLSLASLNILMAANDFLADSLIFATLNSIFALSGFISVVQMRQRSQVHPNKYSPSYNKLTGDLS
ncbi:MAG: hypothetical protein OEQ12_01120 [Nitrosopumilus sp.]|nr:hypothetical protein [Nitrosopumilus sp.]